MIIGIFNNKGGVGMTKSYLLGLLLLSMLLSMPSFASNWQMTYYNPKNGTLLVDKDSIVDTKGSMKKFWTIYAPRVHIGQPSEGYAYSKTLRLINCTDHTAAITQVIYFDLNQVAHNSIVEDKAMRDIIPDSEDDYLWRYICKLDQHADLAAPVGGNISEFLADQVRFIKENDYLLKKTNGQ